MVWLENLRIALQSLAANPLRSVVSRFQALAADPNRAAPNSEEIIIEVNQTASNHNGGTIAFLARSIMSSGIS